MAAESYRGSKSIEDLNKSLLVKNRSD